MHYVHNFGRYDLRIDEVIDASDIGEGKHYVHATVIDGGSTSRLMHATSFKDEVGKQIQFVATSRELKVGYKDASFC